MKRSDREMDRRDRARSLKTGLASAVLAGQAKARAKAIRLFNDTDTPIGRFESNSISKEPQIPTASGQESPQDAIKPPKPWRGMDKAKIGGLGALVGEAASAEHVYDWKQHVGSITIDDPAVIEAIKAKIAKAEASMLNRLQADMFPPLTPEELAEALAYEAERKRWAVRIGSWLSMWRWRLSDAWDALRGRGPSIDPYDY